MHGTAVKGAQGCSSSASVSQPPQTNRSASTAPKASTAPSSPRGSGAGGRTSPVPPTQDDLSKYWCSKLAKQSQKQSRTADYWRTKLDAHETEAQSVDEQKATSPEGDRRSIQSDRASPPNQQSHSTTDRVHQAGNDSYSAAVRSRSLSPYASRSLSPYARKSHRSSRAHAAAAHEHAADLSSQGPSDAASSRSKASSRSLSPKPTSSSNPKGPARSVGAVEQRLLDDLQTMQQRRRRAEEGSGIGSQLAATPSRYSPQRSSVAGTDSRECAESSAGSALVTIPEDATRREDHSKGSSGHAAAATQQRESKNETGRKALREPLGSKRTAHREDSTSHSQHSATQEVEAAVGCQKVQSDAATSALEGRQRHTQLKAEKQAADQQLKVALTASKSDCDELSRKRNAERARLQREEQVEELQRNKLLADEREAKARRRIEERAREQAESIAHDREQAVAAAAIREEKATKQAEEKAQKKAAADEEEKQQLMASAEAREEKARKQAEERAQKRAQVKTEIKAAAVIDEVKQEKATNTIAAAEAKVDQAKKQAEEKACKARKGLEEKAQRKADAAAEVEVRAALAVNDEVKNEKVSEEVTLLSAAHAREQKARKQAEERALKRAETDQREWQEKVAAAEAREEKARKTSEARAQKKAEADKQERQRMIAAAEAREEKARKSVEEKTRKREQVDATAETEVRVAAAVIAQVKKKTVNTVECCKAKESSDEEVSEATPHAELSAKQVRKTLEEKAQRRAEADKQERQQAIAALHARDKKAKKQAEEKAQKKAEVEVQERQQITAAAEARDKKAKKQAEEKAHKKARNGLEEKAQRKANAAAEVNVRAETAAADVRAAAAVIDVVENRKVSKAATSAELSPAHAREQKARNQAEERAQKKADADQKERQQAIAAAEAREEKARKSVEEKAQRKVLADQERQQAIAALHAREEKARKVSEEKAQKKAEAEEQERQQVIAAAEARDKKARKTSEERAQKKAEADKQERQQAIAAAEAREEKARKVSADKAQRRALLADEAAQAADVVVKSSGKASSRSCQEHNKARKERKDAFKKDYEDKHGIVIPTTKAEVDKINAFFTRANKKVKSEETKMTEEHAAAIAALKPVASAAAKKRRRRQDGIIGRAAAGPQVTSALAVPVLHFHADRQERAQHMDITTLEWRKSTEAQKKATKEANIGLSFDQLMEPIIEHVGTAKGRVSLEVVGASQVGQLPLYRVCCHAVQPEQHRILVVGALHPREWHAILTVHNMLHALLNDPQCCGANTRVDFLPCINPDGYELSLKYRAWRGNANHVDLNRNFGIGWGHGERASDDESSQNFQGEGPESEAETQVIAKLLAEGGYSMVLDVHSAAAKLIGYVPPPDQSDTEDTLDKKLREELIQRRKMHLAGIEPEAMSAESQVAMQQMSRRNQQNYLHGPKLEAAPVERKLCSQLSKLVSMEAEWRYSPCGALQCAATERNRIICFIVETKPPKMPLMYCKFDFCKWEAEELAEQLCLFVKQGEQIVNDSQLSEIDQQESVAESVAQKAEQMKKLKKIMRRKDDKGDQETMRVVRKTMQGGANGTAACGCF